MANDRKEIIEKAFKDLGLTEKIAETYSNAEDYSVRYKRCSVVEFTETSYSNTSKEDSRKIYMQY